MKRIIIQRTLVYIIYRYIIYIKMSQITDIIKIISLRSGTSFHKGLLQDRAERHDLK